MRTLRLLLVPALAALVAGAALVPAPAAACGGFFCDNATPVNQAAERILFARHDDGEVTAVIEILYEGPSERFAWMLPVVGTPEIGVSSATFFARLQNLTNPTYTLVREIEGQCADGLGRGSAFDSAAGGPPSAEDGGAGMGPVEVVDAGTVGPYDYVVLSVEDGADDPAALAVGWLQDNAYDVADLGTDRLAPYLESGMNLLAFRLSKGNDTGAIRPVTLGFGSGLPSIPLRPTAVAANDDMGILVWVLGAHRAVPANYLDLELNEALIDWFDPGSTYDDVVTQAANEAGGQGFVTEMAGAAAPLSEPLFPRWESEGWARIETGDWAARHGELVQEVAGLFGGWDGAAQVVGRFVPRPAGVSDEDWATRPWAYVAFDTPTIEGFVPADFLAAFDAEVIAPYADSVALFSEIPYLTRFYTTMSPDEMDMDPVFDENPELGDVDRAHTATQFIECSPSLRTAEAPWRIELADGNVLRGEGTDWPLPLDPAIPAAAVVRRVGPSGEGAVVTDNRPAIAEAVAQSNAAHPALGGCAAHGSGGAAPGLFGLLAVLGLGVRRRRRRRS